MPTIVNGETIDVEVSGNDAQITVQGTNINITTSPSSNYRALLYLDIDPENDQYSVVNNTTGQTFNVVFVDTENITINCTSGDYFENKYVFMEKVNTGDSPRHIEIKLIESSILSVYTSTEKSMKLMFEFISYTV